VIDSHWEFRVADNGIGIDPHLDDSVFDVYYRLHSRDEFDGPELAWPFARRWWISMAGLFA